MNAVIQYIFYLAVLVILAIPLGGYIKKVMDGEKTFLSKVFTPCENIIYKVMRAVSYTHLDVYKRQSEYSQWIF